MTVDFDEFINLNLLIYTKIIDKNMLYDYCEQGVSKHYRPFKSIDITTFWR